MYSRDGQRMDAQVGETSCEVGHRRMPLLHREMDAADFLKGFQLNEDKKNYWKKYRSTMTVGENVRLKNRIICPMDYEGQIYNQKLLVLFIHANDCNSKGRFNCKFPNCDKAQAILDHYDSHTENVSHLDSYNCPVANCMASSLLIDHWMDCNEPICQICMVPRMNMNPISLKVLFSESNIPRWQARIVDLDAPVQPKQWTFYPNEILLHPESQFPEIRKYPECPKSDLTKVLLNMSLTDVRSIFENHLQFQENTEKNKNQLDNDAQLGLDRSIFLFSACKRALKIDLTYTCWDALDGALYLLLEDRFDEAETLFKTHRELLNECLNGKERNSTLECMRKRLSLMRLRFESHNVCLPNRSFKAAKCEDPQSEYLMTYQIFLLMCYRGSGKLDEGLAKSEKFSKALISKDGEFRHVFDRQLVKNDESTYNLFEEFVSMLGEFLVLRGNFKQAIEVTNTHLSNLESQLRKRTPSSIIVRSRAKDSVCTTSCYGAMEEEMRRDGGDLTHDVDKDLEQATIIVEKYLKEQTVNKKGQTVVGSLMKALQIAKDGDVIFLKPGIYEAQISKKNKNAKGIVQIKKSIAIIGASCNQVIWKSSIQKMSKAVVSFKRIKFQLETEQNIHISEGELKFTECLFIINSITGFYVSSKQAETNALLSLNFCCVTNELSTGDHIYSNQRMLAITGPKATVKMTSSYFHHLKNIIYVNEMEASKLIAEVDIEMKDNSFMGIKQSLITVEDSNGDEFDNFCLDLQRNFVEVGVDPHDNIADHSFAAQYVKMHRKMNPGRSDEDLELGDFIKKMKNKNGGKSTGKAGKYAGKAQTIETANVKTCILHLNGCQSVDIVSNFFRIIPGSDCSAFEMNNIKKFNFTFNEVEIAEKLGFLQFANTGSFFLPKNAVKPKPTTVAEMMKRLEVGEENNKPPIHPDCITLFNVIEANIRNCRLRGFHKAIISRLKQNKQGASEQTSSTFLGVYDTVFRDCYVACNLEHSTIPSRGRIFVITDNTFDQCIVGVFINCFNKESKNSVEVINTRFITSMYPFIIPKMKMKINKLSLVNTQYPKFEKPRNLFPFPAELPYEFDRKREKHKAFLIQLQTDDNMDLAVKLGDIDARVNGLMKGKKRTCMTIQDEDEEQVAMRQLDQKQQETETNDDELD